MLAGLLFLPVPAASAADPITGTWQLGDRGGVRIDGEGERAFVGTVTEAGPGRCSFPSGKVLYRLSGSFPDYTGTTGYVDSGTCEPTGDGATVVRLRPGRMTVCSRGPGRGAPLINDPASNCSEYTSATAIASCGALRLRGRTVVSVAERRVLARRDRVAPAAYAVTVQGASCGLARRVLSRALGAGDARVALPEAGLPFVRIEADRSGGRDVYAVEASNGGITLRYRRVGDVPAPRHRVYRAGQQLYFGVATDRRASACTGGFAVRLADGRPGALAAGHCGRREDGGEWPTVFRRADGVRRIGSPVRNLYPAGSDALVWALGADEGSAAQVERGDRSPLTVVGSVPTALQVPGVPVCFAGRSSGADRCGAVVAYTRGTARCTDIETRPGDSGAPAYYPSADGVTRAMGIVTFRRGLNGNMCFEPIDDVLAETGATLSTLGEQGPR